MNVVMLAYPRMTQLDLTGPFEVLAKVKSLSLHLVWKDTAPVVDSGGLAIVPSATFESAPQADILFVPGGPGQLTLMEDEETLEFLRRQAAGAQYVTSVCTGSLVLAAAGLLTGYRATSHWMSLDQLAHFGVEPVSERVVWDRNRVTGAGVTSGIDFGLQLVAGLFGDDEAQRVQLGMEYDPQPPFDSGSPKTATPERVAAAREASKAFQAQRDEVAKRAAARLAKRMVH